MARTDNLAITPFYSRRGALKAFVDIGCMRFSSIASHTKQQKARLGKEGGLSRIWLL
ncbi:MAG: hypothetical protein ACR5LH_09760 [Sodalis sp. (in: enterobacteria)]